MPRTFAAYLLLLALATNPAAAQLPAEAARSVPEARTMPEARRPAGRRLLDEVASERQRGRAAPAATEPDLLPAAPNTRPLESDAVETDPATTATANADRAANYPFDAPLAPQSPPTRRSDVAADDRYGKAPAAKSATPAPIAQADYLEEPSEVQPIAYSEPAQPVDQPLPLEAEKVSPPPAAPAELEPTVEARVQPAQQESAELALPLAPRDELEAGPDVDGQAKPRFGDAKSPLTTMIGSLGLVLMIFFALVWVMRRAAPASLRQMPTDVIEVLGRAPLPGKQQQMHLVRCGRKLLLLASSPTGFTTLTEITDAHEVERLAGLCRADLPRVGAGTFLHSHGESAHEPYGRGYGEESIDSAATALARRLSRSSRLGGSDD